MGIIEVKNLNKFYGHHHILKDLHLTVEEGKIFALLGKNGSGKTTLLKSLLGLTRVHSGEIFIDGSSSLSYESRKNLAYFPEKFSFFPYYKVKDVLRFYQELYGLTGKESSKHLQNLIDLFDLKSILSSRIGKISKGQVQRTGMCCTLLSQAKLIIMDEPFYGLDPIGIKEIKDIFLKLKREGQTLFINSHILSIVEQFADHIAIIDEGHILKSGPINELTQGQQSLEELFYSTVKTKKKLNEK